MKKNILVTGSHRSGTTWTGKVISRGKRVIYIGEPFNVRINRYNLPFKYWFEHMNEDSSIEHQEKVKAYLDSFYKPLDINHIKERIGQIRSLKELYRYLKYITSRLFSERNVIKDPIAIMSAEWIYKNYNIDIVVLIRHPAAFVASLKVKDWQFDFNNFLNQDLLMKNYLKNYNYLIKEHITNKKDIIDQGVLLWNIIHDVIAYYQSRYKNEWCFVKHEDLSAKPIVKFEEIFSKINLTFNSNVKNYINKTTKSKVNLNVEKNSTPAKYVERNSIENIKVWKKRLTDDEILRIKKGTEKVWKKFYSENDW